MKYRLSNRSRDNLKGVHPSLIELINYAIVDSPFDFGIPKYGGARTKQDQANLYAIGRTVDLDKSKVTWTLNSKHLIQSDGYGHAFDLYAYIDGKASWNSKYIDAIGNHILKCAKELNINIQWGIMVKGIHKDKGHFQLID